MIGKSADQGATMAPAVATAVLLCPFDFGSSYYFVPARGSDMTPLEQWGSVIATHQWTKDGVFGERFEYPLGMAAKKVMPVEKLSCPATRTGDECLGWDIVVFTTGAGVMRLWLKLNGTRTERDWYATLVEMMEFATAQCAEMRKVVQGFVRLLHSRPQLLHRLPCVDRVRLADEKENGEHIRFGELYPLYFNADVHVKHPTEPRYGSRAKFVVGAESATVHIGWASAHIDGATHGVREESISVFTAASVSWRALETMDVEMRRFMQESLERIGIKRTELRKDFREVTMSYMQAVFASYPLRWTHAGSNLDILRRIYRAWDVQQLQASVPAQLQFQASFNSSVDAEDQESRNRKLTVFGVTIGAVALGSVFKDLYDVSGLCWNPWLAVLAIVALAGLSAIGLWYAADRKR